MEEAKSVLKSSLATSFIILYKTKMFQLLFVEFYQTGQQTQLASPSSLTQCGYNEE